MAALKLYLGEFPIVENALGVVTINLGKNVHIHIPFHTIPNSLKPGDLLPLYTEVPDHALTRGQN